MGDYNKTFLKRGREYKYAVETYPDALRNEFSVAAQMILRHSPKSVLNIPAACVPLKEYLQSDIHYIEYETNLAFANLTNLPHCELYSIPVADTSVDCVVCLASLHHATHDERRAFFKECLRILSPKGVLIVGDVMKGGAVDNWLNGFVNSYNSSGHAGLFWRAEDCRLFEECGFVSVGHEVQSYMWNFESSDTMIDFCKHLFGLDKANGEKIVEGLHMILQPVYSNTGSVLLPWELGYFTALAP